MIAGIFLAAGKSRRFGSCKLLHKIDGVPLVRLSLERCLESSLPTVHVVVDANNPAVEEEINRFTGEDRRVRIIRNDYSERGQMSSVKLGLASVDAKSAAAMIVLGDMPLVTHDVIDGLLSSFDRRPGITIPKCHGRFYHPRIIPRRYFPEFLRLGDDAKGTDVIDRYHDDVMAVEIDSRRAFLDIDDPSDVLKLKIAE